MKYLHFLESGLRTEPVYIEEHLEALKLMVNEFPVVVSGCLPLASFVEFRENAPLILP